MSLISWDYLCTACDHKEYRVVTRSEQDDQVCSNCGEKTERCLAAPAGWVDRKKRDANQLKSRAAKHNMEIHRGDADPMEDNSGKISDPVQRNKYRTKNTSKTTLSDFSSAHKGWTD